MAILKLVKSEFSILEVTYHADSYEVVMELTGLDDEDVQSLKEIQKLGLEVMFVPDREGPGEPFSMGYNASMYDPEKSYGPKPGGEE